jgi:DNA primase
MDVVEDPAQRALLAEVLLAETKPPDESEVLSAIQELEERSIAARLRDLRALIAEAERRGDFHRTGPADPAEAGSGSALRNLHREGI